MLSENDLFWIDGQNLHRTAHDGSAVWSVPEGVTKMRVSADGSRLIAKNPGAEPRVLHVDSTLSHPLILWPLPQ